MSRRRNLLFCTALLACGALAGSALGTAPTSASIVPRPMVRESVPATFNAISSYRTMDSRLEGQGKLVRAADSVDFPDLALARFVQFELDGDGTIQFPDEAIAVTYNITVAQTEGTGFVQVDGFAFATGETSTINWSGPGQIAANSGVARLTSAFGDSGALGLFVGGSPGAKAHVVLDITGYYMPGG